jgi:prepilin-type processing-associated H-X9-DG protein
VVEAGVGAAAGLVAVDDACGDWSVDGECVLQPAATTTAPSTDTTILTAANYLFCGGHGSHSIN